MTLWTIAHQALLSVEFSVRILEWDSRSLLQGIFPTQGLNSGLLHCKQIQPSPSVPLFPNHHMFTKQMLHPLGLLWWLNYICSLMPSCGTYRLTWVSLTLDVGYLFTAAPANCSHCSLPWTKGISLLPPLRAGRGALSSLPLCSCSHFAVLTLALLPRSQGLL